MNNSNDIGVAIFLLSLSFGLIISTVYMMVVKTPHFFWYYLLPIIYIPFLMLITRFFLKGRIKDGSTSFLCILLFCMVSLAVSLFTQTTRIIGPLGKEDSIFIAGILITFFLFLRNEKFFSKKRTTFRK